MGSRLRILTAVSALCLSATAMAQPGPLPTADFAKQGMDKYNVGDFAGAIPPLEKAVELEPNNFQYKLTLADAYRQTGQCAKARPIYTSLGAQTTDTQVKANIDSGLAACPEATITQPPPSPEPPPPPEPEPVVVESGGASKAGITMLGVGGIGIGLGIGLLIAAHGDAGDADVAAKYDDHDRIDSRSSMIYVAGGVALAAGIGLGVLGFWKLNVSSEHTATVAISPHAGGGSLVLEGAW